MWNKDRHGQDLAMHQANAHQADRELQQLNAGDEPPAPQTLRWIFDTSVDTRQQ